MCALYVSGGFEICPAVRQGPCSEFADGEACLKSRLLWVLLEHLGEHDSDVRQIAVFVLPPSHAVGEWKACTKAGLYSCVPCVLASPCIGSQRCRVALRSGKGCNIACDIALRNGKGCPAEWQGPFVTTLVPDGASAGGGGGGGGCCR